MISRCTCQPTDKVGAYRTQGVIPLPPHMSHVVDERKARGWESPEWLSIDGCMIGEVRDLWDQGIETTGCCCGHGVAPAFIGVIPEHIDRMIELGYTVQHNPMRPGDRDTFNSKRIPPAGEQQAPVGGLEVVAWGMYLPAGQYYATAVPTTTLDREPLVRRDAANALLEQKNAEIEQLRDDLAEAVRCMDGHFEAWGKEIERAEALERERDQLREALIEIGTKSLALRHGGPDPMDLHDLSEALEEAVNIAVTACFATTGGSDA